MTLRVAELMKVAMKHPGLWDDFLNAGTLDDTREFLSVTRGSFEGINKKHFGRDGAGTLFHKVIAPGVEIIDALFGTKLADCCGCAERELKLNDLTSRQS